MKSLEVELSIFLSIDFVFYLIIKFLIYNKRHIFERSAANVTAHTIRDQYSILAYKIISRRRVRKITESNINKIDEEIK